MDFSVLRKLSCCFKEMINVNGSRYTVIERLDQGGFSVIDLVENKSLKKKYVLKRITLYSLDDQNSAMREIELTRKVDNANVIRLVDYLLIGSADIIQNKTSELILVLPFYKNGSLGNHLLQRSKRKDYMSEQEVLQIFLGICDGLAAMHDSKPEPIAHRDLKTANICFSDAFQPVIIDLGSATEARLQVCGQTDAQKLQELAEQKCSMAYRAPEFFSVQSYCTIDERSDIWSLGCLLYAMCYFKSPFDIVYEKGDSVALAILSGNITFPEDSPFTNDMHELILFMLRLNPMERPFIYSVIEKAKDILTTLSGIV